MARQKSEKTIKEENWKALWTFFKNAEKLAETYSEEVHYNGIDGSEWTPPEIEQAKELLCLLSSIFNDPDEYAPYVDKESQRLSKATEGLMHMAHKIGRIRHSEKYKLTGWE